MIFFSFGQIQRKILKSFWKISTNFIPSSDLPMKNREKKINFLDVVIKIKNGKITTNLFCKPTDGHQYLQNYDHAEHIKRSIIFSQTLRPKRICSEKTDFDGNVENLREWFRKKGYPEQLIKNQVARAFQSASNNSANRSKQEKETEIPLVATYHPRS